MPSSRLHSRGRIKPGLIIAIALLAVIGGGSYYFINRAAPSDEAGGKPGGKGRNFPQPVGIAPIKEMDVPVWIQAIGTLTPRSLVVVRTRVEGELQRLAVQEGQQVKAGQLLAEIDPRPLQAQLMQASGQLAKDSALLKNAQLDLERYRGLLEKDAISRQQVDTQEALVRQYQGTVEADRGSVANATLQLAYARITAPVSGRVGLRQVDPGNVVKPGDANGIISIAQVQPILAVFSVAENQLPIVTTALASKTPTPVEIWDREQKNKLASGKLLTADNQIDTATGTLKLKAEFANADNSLFPNQFVNVRLAAGERKGAKVVPVSAIQRGSKGTFIFVVGDEDAVRAVPVTTGPVHEFLQVIEGDVQLDQRVVTEGADKLRDGAKVKPIEARAAGEAGSKGGEKAEGKGRGKREGRDSGGEGERGKGQRGPEGKPEKAKD